jgi:hypothetical protein
MWEKVVLSIKKYNSTCHVDNEDVLVMTQGTFVRLGDVGENYVYAELIVTKLLEDE